MIHELETKMKFYRWELLFLLSLAFLFNQADRALFGILTTSIKEDLCLNSQQMGLAATVLLAVLAILMPITGWVGDRFNKKWIITICLLFWSLSTMLTGLANGFLMLVLFRSVATGGGEAFYVPAAYPMLAAWHKKTRSIAFSIHQGAFYFGVISSGFLAGWIAQHFGGWRSAFYIYGFLGFLLGIVFIFRLKGMPEEENHSPTEKPVPVEKPTIGQTLRYFLTTPTVLLLTVGFSAIVFVNNGYMQWGPALLEKKFELDVTMAGWNSMFYHNAAAFIGILLGGVVTDLFVQKFERFRLVIQALALLLGAPAIYFCGLAGSLAVTCAAFAVFGIFRGLYETNTHAAMFDVVPPEIRSSAVAFMSFVAFLVGSTSPLILGVMADRYGETAGLSYGFQFLGAVYFIGFLAVLVALLFTFKRDRIQE